MIVHMDPAGYCLRSLLPASQTDFSSAQNSHVGPTEKLFPQTDV